MAFTKRHYALEAAVVLQSFAEFFTPIHIYKQRENRRRESLEKLITLHKARAVYLGRLEQNQNYCEKERPNK